MAFLRSVDNKARTVLLIFWNLYLVLEPTCLCIYLSCETTFTKLDRNNFFVNCVSLIDLDLDLVFGEVQETCIFYFVFFWKILWMLLCGFNIYICYSSQRFKGLKRICWQTFPELLQEIVFFETDLAKWKL